TLIAGEGPSLSMLGEGRVDLSTIPSDDANLARRAADRLARSAGRVNDVVIRLEKSIPPGTGLGGGSSDAAATLLALDQLWGLNRSPEQLIPIATAIGSDVPFFLKPGSAVIRGRGERIQRLDASWRGRVVLILPPYGISTEAVYRTGSQGRPSVSGGEQSESHGDAPWSDPSLKAASLMPRLFNDLESAAFRVEPRLAHLHSMLDGLRGCAVRMTGSGSGLFTLFDDESDAEAWRRAARALLPPDVIIRVAVVC
ncbi:MAG: 4-(cytidine 5'-diphospho)-2-C-methyl-D-erythritol kinase, partial [Phycisphaerae bacterium]